MESDIIQESLYNDQATPPANTITAAVSSTPDPAPDVGVNVLAILFQCSDEAQKRFLHEQVLSATAL
ncbi:hypothetical protein EYC80_008381 [Monilinia laxa]|uniref:Uncharacterized protein n=1 Tax=Monilinia laxa TaxID=61186 RepID=A0A5N6JQ35_MONLA|nr:hypothetical protein EYC80_008381 [Monilinia laxa]